MDRDDREKWTRASKLKCPPKCSLFTQPTYLGGVQTLWQNNTALLNLKFLPLSCFFFFNPEQVYFDIICKVLCVCVCARAHVYGCLLKITSSKFIQSLHFVNFWWFPIAQRYLRVGKVVTSILVSSPW